MNANELLEVKFQNRMSTTSYTRLNIVFIKTKIFEIYTFHFLKFQLQKQQKNVLLEDILTKIDMFVLKILSSGFCVLLKMTKITIVLCSIA